jgi:hypothetical protein
MSQRSAEPNRCTATAAITIVVKELHSYESKHCSGYDTFSHNPAPQYEAEEGWISNRTVACIARTFREIPRPALCRPSAADRTPPVAGRWHSATWFAQPVSEGPEGTTPCVKHKRKGHINLNKTAAAAVHVAAKHAMQHLLPATDRLVLPTRQHTCACICW